MFNNNDDVHWGGASVIFALVVLAGIAVMILVSTADFGDRERSSVPRTPGPCEPFCLHPTEP